MTKQEAEQKLQARLRIKGTSDNYEYRIVKYLGEYDDAYYFECVRSDIENPEPRDYIWFTVGTLFGVINMCPRKKMGPISREEAEQLMLAYREKDYNTGKEYGYRIVRYLGEQYGVHYFEVVDKDNKDPKPSDYGEFAVSHDGGPICVPQ